MAAESIDMVTVGDYDPVIAQLEAASTPQELMLALQQLHRVPEVADANLAAANADMLHDIRHFADQNYTAPEPEQSSSTITDSVWAGLIDPEQPTLGLRYRCVSYSGILAAAAQRLRQRGEDICNVVILPSHAAQGKERMDGQAYYAQRGLLVGPDLQSYAGDFPDTIQTHGLSGNGSQHIWDQQLQVRYINSPAAHKAMESKPVIQRILRDAGIAHTEPLVSGCTADDSDLLTVVGSEMAAGRAVVIKPTDGAVGRGVLIADPAVASFGQIKDQLRRAADTIQGSFMVEPRIVCPPLYFPRTGVRADWNIRSIIDDGQPNGRYARVGLYGQAVNISRGAIAMPLQQVLDLYGLSDREQTRFTASLDELEQAIGSALPDAGLFGADIIFDGRLQQIVLELNGENAGGLRNIMQTEREQGNDPWLVPEMAVRGLHRRLFSSPPPNFQLEGRGQNPVRLIDVIHELYTISIDSHPRYNAAAASAVLRLADQLEAQTGVQIDRANFQDSLHLQTDPTRASLSRDNNLYRAKRIWQVHGADHLPKFVAAFNEKVAQDPTDLKLRRWAAFAFINEFGYDTPGHFLLDTFMQDSLGPDMARTVSRSVVFSLYEGLGIKPIMLQISTLDNIESALAEILQAPLGRKPDVNLASLASKQEIEFLGSLTDCLNLYIAVGSANLEGTARTMRKIINSGGTDREKIFNIVYNSLVDIDEHKIPGALPKVLFTIEKACGLYALAYGHARQVDGRQQRYMLNSLSKTIRHNLAARMNAYGCGGKPKRADMRLIMAVINAMTSDSPEQAIEALAILRLTLFETQPEVYESLDNQCIDYLRMRERRATNGANMIKATITDGRPG